MAEDKWDRRFLDLAAHVSQWSKDPSTRCGAVVSEGNRIISLGYNGFPVGVQDCSDDLCNREIKYEQIIHAEINAILHAGRGLKGCAISVYPLPPCARCAAVIVQSGISRVITCQPEIKAATRWGDSVRIGTKMFLEAGVELTYLDPSQPAPHN